MYETRNEFIGALQRTSSADLVESWLGNRHPCVFRSERDRDIFYESITEDWPQLEEVICAGSANWKYSLNPVKNFSAFHAGSDVDVVSVSEALFEETWDRMRRFHRDRWYEIDHGARQGLRRKGENVYSGFICPKWIPSRRDELRFKFVTCLDKYSTKEVGFRDVNMFFFRNRTEAIDYYRRGVERAKRVL